MITSIVIPNYNGERFLRDCINSVYAGEKAPSEVIIVDNGSTDKSKELIRLEYPNVRLIELDNNYGFSKAVNEGIKASKCQYVVLLNNDTVVKRDWLKHLIECIQKDEKVFSCSSKMIQHNNKELIDDAGDEYTLLGWAYKRGDNFSIKYYNRDSEIFSSCGGAAIYRKEIFNEIGYFDENFFAYLEDIDIGYRSRIFGYKNKYCSNAEVYHIGSATSGSKYNSFKAKLAPRNNLYLIYKNMPFIQLLLNIPFLALGYFIKFIFYFKKGLAKEYLKASKEAILNFRKLKKIRYESKNFINYLNIELNLIENCFRLMLIRIIKKPL